MFATLGMCFQTWRFSITCINYLYLQSDGLWHDSDSVSQPQTQYDPWGQTVFPLLQPMPSVYVTTPGQNGHAMHASDWDVLDKSTRDLLSRRGVHFKPPEIASSLLFPNHIPHQSSPSATTRPSASLLSYDAQSPNHPDPPLTAILPAPLLYTPVQSSAPTPSTQWQEATTCSGLTPSPNPMSLMPNSPLSNTSSIAGTPSLVESWSPSSDGGPRTPAGTLYCCKFCKRPYDRFKTWRATSKTNTRGWRPDCSLMDNCGGRTR
jgi:hypothetical protein